VNAEELRLLEARNGQAAWKRLGPYLSERQWGTVREDYGDSENSWAFFPHDHARSRAYRNGEDGIAGICDDKQTLCFALTLWNGRDPILKERLFGLDNGEGNHGEDVKECYYYLDCTPTHSRMKYLYKYPQAPYPYDELVRQGRECSRLDPEFELTDTGVFSEERYFDVFVEYAKAGPEDILIRITACNRGPDEAPLHLLPTLWFRNTWSQGEGVPKPEIQINGPESLLARAAASGEARSLPDFILRCQGAYEWLFTDNETNTQRLFGTPNASPYVKDAFHAYLVGSDREAVNPLGTGTKACAHHQTDIPPGGEAVFRLRLTASAIDIGEDAFGDEFDRVFAQRSLEADEFYADLTPESVGADEAMVFRQALAGMLWTKQFYHFDLDRWLRDKHAHPLASGQEGCRNREWFHMVNDHVISMPDKWEYPWYAAWDLAFHGVPLALADIDFAKEQLLLMLRPTYMHPNGQTPAYEWNFSDVNPPVHAWATLFVYRTQESRDGAGDLDFLKRSFSKLLLNFTWWVNRKDRFGKNIFEGGFLGLDNIGVFDRSKGVPEGGVLDQADGTAWMALFCQNMLEISLELAAHDSSYEDMVQKFLEHFLWIASGMNRQDAGGMWDEEDGFYYDVLRLADGSTHRLRARSMVGLLPLCAATVIEDRQREAVASLTDMVAGRMRHIPELEGGMHPIDLEHRGVAGRSLLSLLSADRLRRVLSRMLDEEEFLSPYGIRSLSRAHRERPYSIEVQGKRFEVGYVPGESDSGMFGGNSNWRGPVWMPVNSLIIRALMQYYRYYGDSFTVEFPTNSGVRMNLFEVSRELSSRLVSLFTRGPDGRRPALGRSETLRNDPHWRDCILFHEYFHGDTGEGLGASHQTGWTGGVAKLIHLFGIVTEESLLASESRVVFMKP